MAEVRIRGVEKRFGEVEVLRGIDLDIADREFVVLVGASGCGKSTLLRMIAGLETVSAGDIVIGDRRVNDLEPRERDIAMVFQSYALYPHLDVRGNMSFALKLRRAAAPAIDAQVGQAASVLNLASLLERFPRQLSGGQRQRVAMGRAIVRHPKVFLFDEPLSNLDAQLRIAMRTEIRALHQRLDATSVYVTHDQVEAMTMADRMVVMNGGRIEQIGAPLEVYDRPRTLFVARFIGSPSINVMEGTLQPGGAAADDGMRVVTRGGAMLRCQVATEAIAARAPDAHAEVNAGVRPEHLVPRDGGPIRGTVVVVENLGPQTHAFVDTADGRLCALLDRASQPRVGDPIALDVAPANVRLFDARTGLAFA